MTIQLVREQDWQQPQQPALFGELTRDGSRIMLIGQGDAWSMKLIGTRLDHLTPLVHKHDSFVVSVPCTWAAVTQLAHTFTGVGENPRWVPGATLQAWILAEFTRRTAPPGPLHVKFPAGMKLRDYQADGAAQIAQMRKFLLLDEPGVGKAQPETTPIWTPAGWNKLGNLAPGDLVYNRYGQPVPIRKVHYQGEQEIWRVTFSDRTTTLASGDHLWRVWTKNDRTHADRANHEHGRVLTTDQIREAGLLFADGGARFYLPQQPVIAGGAEDLPLDPYAYGALLGDGCLGTTDPRNGQPRLSITVPDSEILSSVATAATALGTTWRWNTPSDRCQNLAFHRNGKLSAVLSELGACVHSAGKVVHPQYLHAAEHHRRALLAGLLDTDGNVASGCIEFSSASVQLAADVAWLARSLGAVVTESEPRPAGYRAADGTRVECQPSCRLTIRFPADGPNPFTLPRKADAWAVMASRQQRRNPPRTFQSIEPAGRTRVCCIELDTDDPYARVYLTDTSLIPTHNTCTTIAGLAEIQARGGEIFPMLIVTPSWDVCDVFVREIAAWMPHWRTVLWGGVTGGVRDMGTALDRAGILITTYATARVDAPDAKGLLAALRPVTVVGDEIHAIKSAKLVTAKGNTTMSAAFRRIARHAANAVGLSGTPITRDTGDIYPMLEVLDAQSYSDRKRFVHRYCDTSPGEQYGETIEGLKQLAEPEFRTCLLGQMRRVAKADVLKSLPPKIYSVRRVELPERWRKAYDQMEADMLADLPDDGGDLPAFATITQMMFLARIASAAGDATVTEEPDETTGELKKHYHYDMKAPSWKADALMQILAERPGQPVACFAPYKPLVMIAGKQAEAAGLRVGYVTGTGDGITRATRQRAIADFQAGKLDLIAITTGAGSSGITLTAAGTLVFLQRPWPLGDSIQSEDRCLAAGTPVLTPDGWVPIEDLQAGNLVVTHTGEPQPVTDTWSQQSKRIMAEVSVTGQQSITCTADHRFMLRDGTWREASDLRPGDWLAMPGNDESGDLRSLPFEGTRISDTFKNAWGSTQQNGRLRHAPDTIQVTDDFLYVLGYFAGDGFASTGNDKGRFISFSGNTGAKTAALDRCQRWANSVGLKGARRQQPAGPRGTGTEQRFYSAEWTYWFKAAFTDGSTGATHKRLPDFVLGLNKRQSLIVLEGLAASDGYRRNGKPRCEYVTISRILAANILQLATRGGYRPALANGSTGQLIVTFGGTPGPRSAGRVRSVLLRHPLHLPGEIRERVYDITVKNAETFVAGGVVVHNSHRIGSEIHKHGVEFIDIVAARTVDSRIRERLVEKAGQLSSLVQDIRIVRELLGGIKA